MSLPAVDPVKEARQLLEDRSRNDHAPLYRQAVNVLFLLRDKLADG